MSSVIMFTHFLMFLLLTFVGHYLHFPNFSISIQHIYLNVLNFLLFNFYYFLFFSFFIFVCFLCLKIRIVCGGILSMPFPPNKKRRLPFYSINVFFFIYFFYNTFSLSHWKIAWVGDIYECGPYFLFRLINENIL